MITSGQLARLVEDDGVAGVTSNPTIFEKAIDGSDDYAAQIEDIRRETPELPARQVYERLVTKDIQDVADVLRGTYDRTRGARRLRQHRGVARRRERHQRHRGGGAPPVGGRSRAPT